MSCPHCAHCMGGENAYTSAEAVELGRQVPLVKLPPFVTEYYLRAPSMAMRDILGWLDAQKGTRGRRVLGDIEGFAIVTDEGVWTEQRMPQAPLIRRKVPKAS